jgi:hypothetical protein
MVETIVEARRDAASMTEVFPRGPVGRRSEDGES